MSTAAQETASVSLTPEEWNTVRACLLEHALELSREGEDRLARELTDEIVPAIRQGGESRTLDALEIHTRERMEA